MVKIDITMPTYCYDCPCHDGENGRCNITGAFVFDKRPFDCPLREDKSTTEVEEVRHGEWEDVSTNYSTELFDGEFEVATMKCSKCNRYHNEVYHYGNPTEFAHYCPNCGAKMDGKGKTNEN